MRALASDLVAERERGRALLRENRELRDQLEALREARVCPHCGLPPYEAAAGLLEIESCRHRLTAASAAAKTFSSAARH